MRHTLRFGLVLCVLFHAALVGAASRPRKSEIPPLDASASGSNGPQSVLSSVTTSAYPYYQTLKQYSFEPAGAPDPQGWTTHDLTAQGGVYWHVDDFSGLSGYAPLSGSKSMWCGVRTSSDPAYSNAPGYGDHWTQILESDPVTVLPGQPVGLFAMVTYDVEPNYDFVYVEYKSNGGPWTVLQTFNGAQLTPTQMALAAPGGNVGSSIQFRFVMTSDYSVSDESFQDTHGAIVVDDVRITNANTAATYNFQNFEGASLNATASGIWHGVAPTGFGNYAGLVSGSDVHQNGTPNNTFMWSFFNGSSATYACGGYPSQAAVPYTTTPGSTRPGDYIDNEVLSPWIDLSVDKNNQPANPDMGAVNVDFDAYTDPENETNNIEYLVRWRFMVNGTPQVWGGPLFYGGGFGWSAISTARTVPFAIPAGATHVQIGLSTIDLTFQQSPGGCHTPAPLFDNVVVQRMYRPLRVTNTNDSGTGSLRQAVISANTNPDFNSIIFTISGTGAHTINLTSPLPTIVNPVWIDGFSQPGSIPNTQQFQSTSAQLKIAINGASAGAGANGLWFAPGSVGVVRGLAIGGFSGAGIRNVCTSLITTGCYVGLDATGNVAAPNGTGILNMSQGMDIGGPFNEERMLISNSTGDGIRVMDGGTHIFNCHLGYDALGFEMANQGEGIHVFKGYCQIGEPASGDECRGEYTDRVWIEVSNIVVEPAAQDVMISQVVMEGGMIDLNYDGETANDPGDADSGGNGLQNYPVLTGVTNSTVSGDMDGAPNTAMHIELFSGDGYQAQMHYLGYKDITTNGSGHASFSFSCAPIAPGTHIRATATAGNNTSEFGPWITYNNTPPGAPSPLVNLYDSQQQLRATVQYDAAYSVGNTFLSETTPGALPSPGLWNVGNTPHYWDITTNITYFGNVHVCVNYDPAQVPGPEGVLRLLHYQNGQWVNVTTSVDVVNNQICGVVSSLSPFVIAKPANATGVGDTPVPDTFALRANVPNPFNPTTTIGYDVPRGGARVSIAIYDVNGRLVRTLVDERRAAGSYRAQWNGLDDAGHAVSSGMYFYRMQAGSFNQTRKMVLLK